MSVRRSESECEVFVCRGLVCWQRVPSSCDADAAAGASAV